MIPPVETAASEESQKFSLARGAGALEMALAFSLPAPLFSRPTVSLFSHQTEVRTESIEQAWSRLFSG